MMITLVVELVIILLEIIDWEKVTVSVERSMGRLGEPKTLQKTVTHFNMSFR